MRLHRWALMRFEDRLPHVKPWRTTTSSGVQVSIAGVQNADQGQPEPGISFVPPQVRPVAQVTEVMLHATGPTDYEFVDALQVRLASGPRERLETAISEFAAAIAILGETPWTLYSPKPYLALEAETQEEKALLQGARRIVLPPPKVGKPFMGQGLGQPQDLAALLPDRPDGIMLLSAAVAARGGVATLHELFRVLENAFARGGDSLVKPLANFLSTYPSWDLGYEENEVRMWVRDLRHPGTHADLRRSRRIAYDADVNRHIPRIMQATYDVLFNKAKWQTIEQSRAMRWAFSCALRRDGTVLTDGTSSTFRTAGPYDHFGTWSLADGVEVTPAFPDDTVYLLGAWHFSEDDWALFETPRED